MTTSALIATNVIAGGAIIGALSLLMRHAANWGTPFSS
jgi:hypothetical protein